jgi:uncharacterized membrane protein
MVDIHKVKKVFLVVTIGIIFLATIITLFGIYKGQDFADAIAKAFFLVLLGVFAPLISLLTGSKDVVFIWEGLIFHILLGFLLGFLSCVNERTRLLFFSVLVIS